MCRTFQAHETHKTVWSQASQLPELALDLATAEPDFVRQPLNCQPTVADVLFDDLAELSQKQLTGRRLVDVWERGTT